MVSWRTFLGSQDSSFRFGAKGSNTLTWTGFFTKELKYFWYWVHLTRKAWMGILDLPEMPVSSRDRLLLRIARSPGLDF
jgi:hypothetical protein